MRLTCRREGEQVPHERVVQQDLLDQGRQAVDAFTHIRHAAGDVNLDAGWSHDHRAPPSSAETRR